MAKKYAVIVEDRTFNYAIMKYEFDLLKEAYRFVKRCGEDKSRQAALSLYQLIDHEAIVEESKPNTIFHHPV